MQDATRADATLNRMTFDIRELSREEFPKLLDEIPQPPKRLFVRGEMPSEELHYLAVVGSRKCTSYGIDACEQLIAGLAGYPVVIVSGLALGIDSVAHKTALKVNLPTIAIPGSGLDWDVLYPRSNTSLAHAILENGGALLSEYEPKQQAAPWTFPERNRIMAGLSHATLLIEAGEKSGTLITARLATDYNRELLAVPGSIFSDNSRGVHQFLKLGATMVTTSEDILTALGIDVADGERERADLSEQERAVLSLLGTPLQRDELIRAIGLPTSEATTLLSDMELKGLIVDTFGEIRKV